MLRLALAIAVLYLADNCYGFSLQLKPYNQTAIIMFLQEDLNQDGHFTRDEMNTSFTRYDANGDGIETRFEYTEAVCRSSPNLYELSHYLFDEYDLNGDHVLEELDYEALFDNMDPNTNPMLCREDDVVTPAEFIAYWERIFPRYENVGYHPERTAHGYSPCHTDNID